MRSLVLTQYRGVTDRHMYDGFAVAYTALAKLALQSSAKEKIETEDRRIAVKPKSADN